MTATLRETVASYYNHKIEQYGPTPLGVDWSCVPTQEMRFVQLLKVCNFDAQFSLNDLGCGYGALVPYLVRRHRRHNLDYLGVDLSASMVHVARQKWKHKPGVAFEQGHRPSRMADYSVASGIFNVKLNATVAQWEAYIANTLDELHATSRIGFACNFLTLLAPGSRDVPQLYRAASAKWVTHCETQFNAEVAILDAYGMREFTLLIHPRAR